MKNIINYLSPEAKSRLFEYKHCNVGFFINSNFVPKEIIKNRVYTVCLYPKNTVFDQSSNAGKSITEYQKNQPLPVKSFTVVVRDSSFDSGYLFGVLKKHSTQGFLYKPFDSENFKDFGCVRCDYANTVAKLLEPYSFRKGGGRMY